ncbi:MAG: leucine-rich repeat protein [Clostridia bacterium]|nr:leucine-rich repeat protein [Clostridia bacterium]
MVEQTEDTKDKSIPGVYYASEQEVEESGVAQAPMSEKGGALYIGSGTTYTMSGGTLKSHSATFGGAVYVAAGGTFNMNGGAILMNEGALGGAIYVEAGGTVNLNGGFITGNIAENGAAIYSAGGTIVQPQDSTIFMEHNYSQAYENYVYYYIDGKLMAVQAIEDNAETVTFDHEDAPLDYNNCPGYFADAACTQYVEDGDTLVAASNVQSVTANNFETVRLYTKTATLDKITFTLNDDTYSVSKQGTPTGELVIPRQHENKDVTSIGSSAFSSCWYLTSVTIPDSVTSIGDLAFFTCSRLTGTLTIPSSVTSIGEGAFYYCSGLTGTLTIPNSVTSIGNRSFYGCSGLTGTLTIPNSVTSTGQAAFRDCSGFTGTLIIPSGVTSILPDTFYGCSGFTSVTIPNSVTSIGTAAFSGCSGLTGALIIPNSVTTVGQYAFQNCTGFTELIIPNSVTTIRDYAFYGCSGFTGTLVIPNRLTMVENYVFLGCIGFTGLTIPSSVTSIGNFAFQHCSGFTGSLIIPNSVTSIGQNAFEGCSELESVYLPNSVSVIRSGSFMNCSVKIYTGIENAESIPSGWESGWNLSYLSTGPVSHYYPVNYDYLNFGGNFIKIAHKIAVGSVSNSNMMHYIEYGEYPQTYVGNALNSELENWYNSISPAACKSYVIRGNEYYAYQYNNSLYLRFVNQNAGIYGESYQDGTVMNVVDAIVWFKIEPIKWIITNYSDLVNGNADKMDLLSYSVLICTNIYFNEDDYDYADSVLSGWLNQNFLNETFTASERANMVNTSVDENDLTITRKVYLRSVQELSDGAGIFSQNGDRLASPTDLCISTSYAVPINVSESTALRTGVCNYWTRTISNDTDAYFVDYTGPMVTSARYFDRGIRPAISINCESWAESQVNLTVTSSAIVDNRYKNNTLLEHLTIGNNVSSIGQSSFEGCTNLETVTFEEGVTAVLSANLFKDCTSLTTVTCASGQNEFWDSTFTNCPSLESVVIRNKAIITDFPVDRSSISSNVYLMAGYDETLLDNIYLNITEYNLRASMTTLKALANIAEYLGYGDMDVDVKIYKYSASNPGSANTGVNGWWHYDANNKPVKW